MKYNLSGFLESLEDFRRGQGLRYPLAATMLMIIMSIINGAKGYREIARFMSHHEDDLSKYLDLKHGVPSHVSVRTILLGIDLQGFNKSFIKWMSQELELPKNKWLSIDGKAIRSTLNNPGNNLQDFVQVVSVFSHNSSLALGQQSFMSKKAKEAESVRELITSLDKQGLYICLDALHCQKKH